MKAGVLGDSRDFSEWFSKTYCSACSKATVCSLPGNYL